MEGSKVHAKLTLVVFYCKVRYKSTLNKRKKEIEKGCRIGIYLFPSIKSQSIH